MKIKELKKQIPHNKLRPMHGLRKKSTGVSHSSGSPKVASTRNTIGRHKTVVRQRPQYEHITIAATPKPGRLKLEKLTPKNLRIHEPSKDLVNDYIETPSTGPKRAEHSRRSREKTRLGIPIS